MTKTWKNFTTEKLSCQHCGEQGYDEASVDKLQALRDLVDKPIYLNSAYRCPIHNQRVGGTENSYHLKGVAFDLSLRGHNIHDLYKAAKQVGFTGFGWYNTFLHVDTGPSREWDRRT